MELDLTHETRRPVLVKLAREHGIDFQPNATVNELKESIMAATKLAPAKPAPKPAAAAAKPPPPKGAPAKPAAAVAKPAAAAAKPAAPGKPAPAPAKPGAPKPAAAAAKPNGAPAKPGAAPAKPGGPGPGAKSEAATKGDLDKLRAEFAALSETVTKVLEAQAERLDRIDLSLAGFGPFVSTDDTGAIVLDLDNADEETYRNWSHMFAIGDCNDAIENIVAAFKKTQGAKSFKGWEQKNVLPRPEPGEAVAEGEGEGEELTLEQVATLNWTDACAVADQCGIDYSDISKPQQPKVLRSRIVDFLTAAQAAAEGGEEAAGEEAAAEGELPFEAGTTVHVQNGDEVYEATFDGLDENEAGNYLVTMSDEQYSVAPDTVTLPE